MGIKIALDGTMRPGKESRGIITADDMGRSDGIVINAQVLDSNELVRYTICNGKKISQETRLFIPFDDIKEGRAEFCAMTDAADAEVKFRASIIEQHKEIESATLFLRTAAL